MIVQDDSNGLEINWEDEDDFIHLSNREGIVTAHFGIVGNSSKRVLEPAEIDLIIERLTEWRD